MKTLLVAAVLTVIALPSLAKAPIGIVIHGGAGTISRDSMTPAQEQAYHAMLTHAVNQGYSILERGDSSLDAVSAAVTILEDSPLFNAGKGAVYTYDETHELDASIMDGKSRNAGAVAGVTNVKNPILLARAVMEKSVHVMLAGKGAEQFAKEQQLELVLRDIPENEMEFMEYHFTTSTSKITQNKNEKLVLNCYNIEWGTPDKDGRRPLNKIEGSDFGIPGKERRLQNN